MLSWIIGMRVIYVHISVFYWGPDFHPTELGPLIWFSRKLVKFVSGWASLLASQLILQDKCSILYLLLKKTLKSFNILGGHRKIWTTYFFTSLVIIKSIQGEKVSAEIQCLSNLVMYAYHQRSVNLLFRSKGDY